MNTLTVTITCNKNGVRYEYSTRTPDDWYGRRLCGYDAAAGHELYDDQPTEFRYGRHSLSVSPTSGNVFADYSMSATNQYYVPRFWNNDTALERAQKLLRRINELRRWIGDCDREDSKRSESATLVLDPVCAVQAAKAAGRGRVFVQLIDGTMGQII